MQEEQEDIIQKKNNLPKMKWVEKAYRALGGYYHPDNKRTGDKEMITKLNIAKQSGDRITIYRMLEELSHKLEEKEKLEKQRLEKKRLAELKIAEQEKLKEELIKKAAESKDILTPETQIKSNVRIVKPGAPDDLNPKIVKVVDLGTEGAIPMIRLNKDKEDQPVVEPVVKEIIAEIEEKDLKKEQEIPEMPIKIPVPSVQPKEEAIDSSEDQKGFDLQKDDEVKKEAEPIIPAPSSQSKEEAVDLPSTQEDASPQKESDETTSPEPEIPARPIEPEISFQEKGIDIGIEEKINEEADSEIPGAQEINELAGKELVMNSLWQKIIKRKKIARKYNLKYVYSEIEKEYEGLREEYNILKEKLLKKLKIEEDKLKEEITRRSKKLGEIESRFKKEQAKEYLSHSRKIIEYKKESLTKAKNILFEKVKHLAKNKKVQFAVGAILVGISVPPTSFINLLLGGSLPQDIVSISPVFRVVGAAAGGYIMATVLELRKTNNLEDDGFQEDKEIKIENSNEDSKVRKIGYLVFKEPKSRNNFFTERRDIQES